MQCSIAGPQLRGIKMPNGEYKVIMSWALKILGVLITAGIVASVSMQWRTSQAVERIESGVQTLEYSDVRQERLIERIDDKIDKHIIAGNGGI